MDMADEGRRDEQSIVTSVGALPGDPWYARLAFHVLGEDGPGWLTLWLVLIIGGLIAFAAIAGPWVPGVIAAVGSLAAGGTALAKRVGTKTPVPSSVTRSDRAARPPAAPPLLTASE